MTIIFQQDTTNLESGTFTGVYRLGRAVAGLNDEAVVYTE